MIANLSDMLLAFMNEESSKLSDYELKHNPTIGSMYEGLSADILRSSIPKELDLQVVDGVIVDAAGNMSGQIDCMLVTGSGEKIPYTDSYKWPVWDVLAVFEVKKNLYGKDLADSFDHLKTVSKTYSDWLFSSGRKDQKIDPSQAFKAFSTITGVQAPNFPDRESLPEPLQLMYHTLLVEQITPLLIVFGYNGYKTEGGLRQGLLDFLEANWNKGAYGVPHFPHLITCNGHSLVKANGQPYMPPMENGKWPFYASSPSNPLWIMLELIWTKITNRFSRPMPWGEDLEEEVFHRFLDAEPVLQAGSGGWKIYSIPFVDPDEPGETKVAWEPVELTDAQHAVFMILSGGGEVDTADADFAEFIDGESLTVNEFISQLRSTGLVALNGTRLELTTSNIMTLVTPEGKVLAGENNTGRMARYMSNLGRKGEA